MASSLHPSEIASEVPYTGFLTLTVFTDGSWISPADGARVYDGRVEAGRFAWGFDEGGDCCYNDLPSIRRKALPGHTEAR